MNHSNIFMDTHYNEIEVNDGANEMDPSAQNVTQQGNEEAPTQPGRKKYHSSALYAASMWHSTVKHVKPPHSGGSLLPTQA